MPTSATIPMIQISEPALPIREAMDEQKLYDLAEDIRANGLLQPVGVKRDGERYEIIFGHRRFMAHQKIHAQEIEARIFEDGELPNEAAMLAENLFREDLSDAEVALWLHDLRHKHGWDEEKLCKAVKKSADWVGDRLRLFDGDQDVFTALRERKINFSVARELNKCKDDNMRNYFLHQAIMATPPARVVTQWVSSHLQESAPASAAPASDQPPVQHDTPQGQTNECGMCGGNKDPYNLIFVHIHRHCWDNLMKAVQEAATA